MNNSIKSAGKKVAKDPSPKSIRVTKTLSLDHDTYEAVKRKCFEVGMPISTLIDELLKAWLAEV